MQRPSSRRALSLLVLAVACTPTSDGSDHDASAAREADPPAAEPAKAQPATPVLDDDPDDAVVLAGGHHFTCALQRAGTVACWGENRQATLGQWYRTPVKGAVLVEGINDAVTLAATASGACVVRRNGSVICWGDQFSPWLNGEVSEFAEFVEILGIGEATALFSGDLFEICAITETGTWCWDMIPPKWMPLDLFGREGFTRLPFEGIRALRLGHRDFAFFDDGRVMVWDEQTAPTEISDVVEVLPARGLECMIWRSGDVSCTDTDTGVKIPITGLRGARSLSFAGPGLTGVLPDGTMASYGVGDDDVGAFQNPSNIVALTNGMISDQLISLRGDGRVFEWVEESRGSLRMVPREIVLPDPADVVPMKIKLRKSDSSDSPSAPDVALPPVSAEAAATAGKRCGEGWTKFQAGELAAAKLDVDDALLLLERARDSRGLRSLGACLYNRGRIAEQEGNLDEARRLYERSLAARPNDTVAARLDSLLSN
jgi:hypothetical protein